LGLRKGVVKEKISTFKIGLLQKKIGIKIKGPKHKFNHISKKKNGKKRDDRAQRRVGIPIEERRVGRLHKQ